MPHVTGGSKSINVPYLDWFIPPPLVDGFPLPAGNFISAKMPMYAVYPRPQGESVAHARHKWAHSGMEYTIPIAIQGGAWPFVYELIDSPTGATIGTYYDDANYGIVKWNPPASGAFKFVVRVTDQDENEVTITWNVTVDDTKFLFIQDGWAGTKTGTISEPLEDINDWYKGDQNDATYHNKIVVLRGGNYSLVGDAVNSSGNLRLLVDTKTPSIIGFPSETPIVDCSTAKVITDTLGMNDLFIAGIRWENSRQDVNNAHFFWVVGDANRITVWDNYLYNHAGGLVGNDNDCGLFVSSTTEQKQHLVYKGNTHDLFANNGGGNGSYCDFYHMSYIVVEDNTAKNSTTNYGFWMKKTISFVTVRANIATDNVDGNQISIGYSDIPYGFPPHDHEVCWNHVVVPASVATGDTLLFAVSNDHLNETYNSFIYRNTVVNGKSLIRFPGIENFKTDGNVIINNNLASWDTSIMDTVVVNVTGLEGSGIVDANGLLTGASRVTYLGKAGHEISEV